MSHPLTARTRLAQGLEQLALTLAIEPLLHYLTLLQKWNRAYNLTAITELDDMITRHLLDSLAITPWVAGTHILDVGSGAGFPGIPLALAYPDYSIVLLDSNGKKVRFMQEVKRQLQLSNVDVQHVRVEQYQPQQKFDTITSRAFSNLAQMVTWTNHLITETGIWLAMKGHLPDTELTMLKHPYNVQTYCVPGLEGARCCVIINNVMKG